jgi:hypothetical protein
MVVAGGGTPVVVGGGSEPFPPASRRRVEVVFGFSRGTRSPGAAALGSTVEAAFFFVGGGRLVAGVAAHEIPLLQR